MTWLDKGFWNTKDETYGYPYHEKDDIERQSNYQWFWCRNYRGCRKGRSTELCRVSTLFARHGRLGHRGGRVRQGIAFMCESRL
ncbi:hypothetical protein HED51_11185 [Ochrobactrum grignonense]|nr:hypothetical protein [Brucella grignonensis]